MDSLQETLNTCPSGFEWDSSLAKRVGKGAVFQLYLAISNFSDPSISFENNTDMKVEDNFPERVNLYRRSEHYACVSDIDTIRHWRNGLSNVKDNKCNYLRLWQSINPDPLCASDSTKRLPEDVVANCNYLVQKKLQTKYSTHLAQQENENNKMPLTPANLVSLIPEANNFEL